MIPLQLNQIWIGPKKMNTLQKLHMNHNKAIFKNKYKLWKDKDINENNFPFTYSTIKTILKQKIPKYAQVSDLMRYEILFHHGGVYADMNIEFVKPIKSILHKADRLNKTIILSHQDDKSICPNPLYCNFIAPSRGYYISNSFIASTVENKSMLKLISSSINIQKQINQATGPYYLRKHLDLNSVLMLPTKAIYPFNWSDALPYTIPSKNKCISIKPQKNFYPAKSSCGTTIYVKYPCLAYKSSYAIKHWDTGGSWVQSPEKQEKCKLLRKLN